jgi:hypothetical protein
MKARGLADPEGTFHQTIFLLVLSNEKATKFLLDTIFIGPNGGKFHGNFSPLEIIITQSKRNFVAFSLDNCNSWYNSKKFTFS